MRKYFVLLFTCISFFSNAQNKYTDSLKASLPKTDEPIKKFDLQNRLLEYSYMTGKSNPDSAYCIQLLDIAQELDNDSLLAIAYNQLGNYFFRNNIDLTKGLEYFFKGLPFAQKVNDKRRISSLYIDIAAIYYKLSNPAEEIKYIRKALANLPDKSSSIYPFMLAQAQYESARFFLGQEQTDSALYYAQALGVTNLTLKSQLFETATNGLLGQVYDKMGDSVLAEAHMTRANVLNDSIHYLYGKIEGKRIYINFLLKSNKIPEAKKQALLLMDIGIQNKMFDAQKIAAGCLTTVYDKTKVPDSAFYYSRIESAMKDSLFNQDKLNKIQSLAFDERIRIMEEEDKVADEAEQRRLNIQYVLIFLGIVTFILLFIMLSRSIIVTEKSISFLGVLGLLIVFEFINLLIHPFLERITHHSPVLMLLALVLIASLLIPLHHRLEKWIKEKMTEKNKKIRLAAAKKTIEQLGQNGN
jgi:tetratricopeptide (TPR) repeat protein